ncbi:MAG TPA: tRNA (adenosine(37)-N6)-dimethylallyltransferase MiaA [Candidatus Bipolaricaulis anaerobius]|nr:tRNA (adenosine(37)-N6)-dimethylallyltransferase MiaA [Candidatus Bipolaricaulis anaerobius]HNS23674.1 tRNA (adenosine(37)-N6)-dimethylallyltransferase MiaA [Candidatus Bipolaricaulis anaerobius]
MTVLLLVGPTAAGKSEVAVAVAEAVGGEIISADARAIYRGLEIGTDRPPREVLARVPHHLVGTLDPWEHYDAARFRADCERLVSEIQGRDHRAIIVGGSTLYVRALTRGLSPGPAADPELRAELAQRPTAELREELARVDPASAARIHPADRVRLVRAVEVHRLTGRPLTASWGSEKAFPWPLVPVGLTVERSELGRRIEARVARMLAEGLIEEARRLWNLDLPSDAPAVRTIGYRELFPYFAGEYDLDEARRRIVRNTKAYARRQLAFFRAEPRVHWLDVTGRPASEVATEVIAHWQAAESGLE